MRRSHHRSREIAWKKAHEQELERDYAGMWVAVDGDRLIAHGADALDVVRRARSQRIRNPYVFLVERQRRDASWLGL